MTIPTARPGAAAAPAGKPLRLLLAVAVIASALAAGVAGPAAADPLGDAKAQASALNAQVNKLQVEAESATERYDAAEAALAQLVGEQHAAQEEADAAQRLVDTNRAIVNERARALYMSGGSFSLYASVLQGADPTALLAGLHDVQSLSNADNRMLSAMDAASDRADRAKARVDTLLDKQTELMAQASAAATEVETKLAERRQALDQATAQVRAIEAEIQARVDAENAARAAAALAAARATALAGGFIDGPASPVAQAAIGAAETQLGKPYVYGGAGPNVWDCSGLTQWAYRQAGVNLPRTAAEQYLAVAAKVQLGQLRPGDLLFWATDLSNPATIHHVAIYLGAGQMLAAPHTGEVVRIQPVYLTGYFGAARPA